MISTLWIGKGRSLRTVFSYTSVPYAVRIFIAFPNNFTLTVLLMIGNIA